MATHKKKFDLDIQNCLKNKRANNRLFSKIQYDALITRLQRIKAVGPWTSEKSDYYSIAKYDLQRIGDDYLVTLKNSGKRLVHTEQLFELIQEAHHSIGHGGRQATHKLLKEKYDNISQEQVTLFIEGCESCQIKGKKVAKGGVVKSLTSDHINSRCQIDLIDLQTRPDRDYKFVMVYQDHLTKYIRLCPLKSKTATEVAYKLADIFADFGIPCILESDNGREFAKQIVLELTSLWPECHIVHGKPSHTLGSVEMANIENKIAYWMLDNNNIKWSEGLRFVQCAMNRTFHSGIQKTPYEAMFGIKAKDGLKSLPLPQEIRSNIKSEEDLENFLRDEDLNTKNNDQNVEETLDMYIKAEITFEPEAEPLLVMIDSDCNNHLDNPESTTNKFSDIVHFDIPQALEEPQVEDVPGKLLKCDNSTKCSLCSNLNSACPHFKNDEIIQNNTCECKTKRHAKEMLSTPKKRLCGEIGMTVRIPIPDVDRSRTDNKNVLGIIMSIEENGFYRIGTVHGTLKELFSKNQFYVCKQQMLSLSDVKQGVEITLKTAVDKNSIMGTLSKQP